jgi:OFA family oxalate/formate antiporter-like MFS transporter
MIESAGFQSTFLFFGILQGSLAFVAAGSCARRKLRRSKSRARSTSRRATTRSREALSTKLFWLMLVMFVLVVTGGMMAVAQLGVIAKDLGRQGVQGRPVLLRHGCLPLALMLDRIMNGISRPLFGWISTISAARKPW